MKKKHPQISSSTESRVTGFVRIANVTLDFMKKGAQVDRKALAHATNRELTEPLNPADAETLIGVIMRARTDFETIKGKAGGTFKL